MARIVQNSLVQENEGFGRTINQLIELFVDPEIKKRGKKGFQVAVIELFDDERKSKVYLDEDAPVFELKMKKSTFNKNSIGKTFKANLNEIQSIRVTDEKLDQDSAKVFLVKWGGEPPSYWILGYDFRYNKGHVKTILNRTTEIIAAVARISLTQSSTVVLALLTSAFEMVVDAYLFLIPGLKAKAYSSSDQKLQDLSNFGNFLSDKFVNEYKELKFIRNKATHGPQKGLVISENYKENLISVLEKEINSTFFPK
jgi:hypothetical protein